MQLPTPADELQSPFAALLAHMQRTDAALAKAKALRYETMSCAQLRQLLRGVPGSTAAVRAGKAAMVAFAAERRL